MSLQSEWKDVTSYRRNEERLPTTWSKNFGDLRIAVTSGHIHNKGNWTLVCHPWFDCHDLNMPTDVYDKTQAQEKAVKILHSKIKPMVEALEVYNV